MNIEKVKNKIFKGKNINKDEKIIITSLTQYRSLIEKGYTNFDFSNLDIDFDDIQDINLENRGLDIDLDKIFLPYHGRVLYHNTVLCPLFRLGDDFIDLTNSNLKGNNVIGDLKNKYESGPNGLVSICTFIYSENTFDENYKMEHPEFFLDSDAPEKLKDKFYKPAIKIAKIPQHSEVFEYQDSLCLYRQTLTFDEYQRYYEFLKGKYIERFNISADDYVKIREYQQLMNNQSDDYEHINEENNHPKKLIKTKL